MLVYLDVSIIVSIFTTDIHSGRALVLVGADHDLILSDFAVAEVASAVSGLYRAKRLDRAGAQTVFGEFDNWAGRACQRTECLPQDVSRAAEFMRRLDLSLRTPDAVHVAMAYRLGASLGTFDIAMAQDARRLGLEVIGA